MYTRTINGQTENGLPQVGKLKNGQVVSNYDRLPLYVLQDEGWSIVADPPIIESPPQTTLEDLATGLNEALIAIMQLSIE